ncbi:DUF5689 domain-containing protein [Cesiribacter andamanensis]|uniref:LTD domain-containing protein n=1 Tax=Cesiribacter andamanensis AMV16 TaxID=1279009 RepID=M7N4P5_9BACT|nr:DUF5689 domain-containing protein [Cesiribacter andamanensis]EMR02252.1 hypothetical protein ADICEAN_02600 [Cesiribacter andamanensis AMV16]
MIKNLLLRGLIFQLLLLAGAYSVTAQTVFINEIHYDNVSTDVGEAIEIAGPAGTDLTGWKLVLYNGNGGTAYDTKNLTGSIPDPGTGFGFVVINSFDGIQNGAPDGIALVDASGAVVQFLSYEGTMTAIGGAADGMTSTDIGVYQNGNGPIGHSLQLTGTGTTYADFTWATEAANTFGAANNNQTFGTGGGTPDPEPEPEEPEEPEQPTPIGATTVFINEIHYDNAGTDIDEAIEIAAVAGTDLTGWQLILYNGNGGGSYNTQTLSGSIANTSNGWGFMLVEYPSNGIQNGAPDGIALVNAEDQVVQFLSYEGTFVATNGPAAGMSSTDISVSQSGSDPVGNSLQLTGTGVSYADFTWTANVAATYSRVNAGQTLLSPTPIVFINEIHYDNTGTDAGEAIELAASAGTNLEGWSLVLYNGGNGAAYNTRLLTGEVTNQNGTGFGFVSFTYPVNGIQNGDPDGIALVDPSNTVIQFLSYGGTFTAVGGPANGMTSTDIGLKEGSGTPVGHSLQLTGSGSAYGDFTWTGPVANTFGSLNTGQSFGSGTTEPDPEEPVEPQEVSIAQARTLPQGTPVIVTGTLTVSSELGGPAFIQDATGGIALFDSQVHGEGNFAIGDRLKVTASIGAFNQQIQLVEVTELEKLEATTTVEPVLTTIAGLRNLEGQLVRIENVTFADTRGLLFPESNYRVSDGTGTIDIRIDGDVESLVGRLKPQEAITLTGVVGSFRGTLQILPRFIEDLPGTAPYVAEGSDIPVSTTLEVMSWNMEFFGSTLPTFGPQDVQLQKENAKKLIQASNADIIAVQEISDEALLQQLVDELGYALICSDRFSYSFNDPDPTFPEQKVCFIYNPAVVTVQSARVLFEEMYDQARSGESTALDNYPGSGPSSFWSSGRLPYMLTVDATIGGITEHIRLINIHAKSGSASADLTRRRYDVQALKDTLDRYYPNDNIILLGDYNDDVDVSIGGGPSTYSLFVDAPDFNVVTSSLSEAGLRSFITQDNVIDHIAISNELYDNYLPGSESLIIPFSYIWNYGNTTSDHLPVLTRFEFYTPLSVSITGDQLVYAGYAPEACTTLSGQASGGKGDYTYSWSTGGAESQLEVCPEASTTYTLTVADSWGNTATESYEVCAVATACQTDKIQLCWQPNPAKARFVQLCLPEQLVEFYLNRGASLGECFAAEACTTDKTVANSRSTAISTAGASFISISSELQVRPSLARTTAQIDFVVLEEGHTSVKVYSLAGQEVARLYAGTDAFGSQRSVQLNVSQLKAGMYLVKMTTASGAVFSSKLMVAR